MLHFVLPLLMLLLVRPAGAVWLTMPSSGSKCVAEEIQADVVVLAEYGLVFEGDSAASTIAAKVTSPFGNVLHHNKNATTGHFAFTTTESGSYLACFWLDSPISKGTQASVNLDWKTGIAAKDWESIAKKDKLEGVELELKKLEEIVESVHENMLFLKTREAEMRDLSEQTNARVAWFSIMSIAVCLLVSAWQLFHLTSFFQKKKLI